MPDTEVKDQLDVEEPKAGADGKYPDVPYTKYIGVKEKFTRVETQLKGQVADLEAKLKASPNPDEFSKTKAELETVKTNLIAATTELNTFKEKSILEKRKTLIEKGLTEEQVKGLSEKEMTTIAGVLGTIAKPKADTGGGGGITPSGNAKERIRSGFDTLHPIK